MLERRYDNATIAALMTLARGACYWPDCGQPTVRMVNAVPVMNLEIARIRGLKPGSKRYDSTWTVEQRNSFTNLILLCSPHHKTVDGRHGDRYPVTLLESWKHARETDGLDALAGLGQLTEDKLSTMIATAQAELLDRIGPALDQFAQTAPDLAALLRVLTDELADPRVHGFGISEDAIDSLHQSARALADLEDHAAMLRDAADDLRNLEDNAQMLMAAAKALQAAAARIEDAKSLR